MGILNIFCAVHYLDELSSSVWYIIVLVTILKVSLKLVLIVISLSCTPIIHIKLYTF